MIEDWVILHHVCDLIVTGGWIEQTQGLIASYARPSRRVRDLNRPERIALESLYPNREIENVISHVVSHDHEATMRQRINAWELYHRLVGEAHARRFLFTVDTSSLLVQSLKDSINDIGIMPVDRHAVAWLFNLRSRYGTYWNKALGMVQRLSRQQREGIQFRHLPILLALDEASLLDRREVLVSDIHSALDKDSYYGRYEVSMQAAHQHRGTQRFIDVEPLLSWSDLQIIRYLLFNLNNRVIAEELFRQADIDHADKESEHGGVVTVEHGGLSVIGYKPEIRGNDRRYYASLRMIEKLYTSIAHYHFHAQEYKNRAYAGPGEGDLDFADRMGFTCLVFTYIDKGLLNIDYYQPGGVVVDLGVIRRPSR